MKEMVPIGEGKVEKFYEKLRKTVKEKLSKFAGKYGEEGAKILLAFPDLVILLWRLVKDERVSPDKKIMLGAVLTYIILPTDLLPEAVMGVVGYADDIFLALYTLNELINNVGEDVIRDNWPGDEDVIKFIRESLKIASVWMEKSGKNIRGKLDALVSGLLKGRSDDRR